MKNILRFVFIGSLFLFVFVTQVFAEEVKSEINTNTKDEWVMIADTNILNPEISSKEGNKLDITFNISNGKDVQTGIKYGVELVKVVDNHNVVVDSKVYDEYLTLGVNTEINKSIVYEAPLQLSGNYDLYLTVSNNSGLYFLYSKIGNVSLESNSQGILISADKCFVKEVNSDKKYKLFDLARIDSGSDLVINCEVVNALNENVSLVPHYEVRTDSLYSDMVNDLASDTNPVSLNANETKSIESVIPKVNSSGTYSVTFYLSNDKYSTNKLSFKYMVNGPSTQILNLSLDKDYYIKGETALLKLSYTNNDIDTLYADVLISNDKGKSCSSSTREDISVFKPVVTIPVKMELNCKNPQILIKLVDDKGIIFSQRAFTVDSMSFQKDSIDPLYIIIPIIIILILLIIIKLIKNRKNGTSTNVPIGLFLIGLFLLSLVLIPGDKTEAAVLSSSDGQIRVSLNYDNEYYSKENINFDGYAIVQQSGVYAEDIFNIDLQIYTDDDFRSEYVRNPSAQSLAFYGVAGVITADASRGNHNIHFDVSYSYYNSSNVRVDKSIPSFFFPYYVHLIGVTVNKVSRDPITYNTKDRIYWEAIDAVKCTDCKMINSKNPAPGIDCPAGFLNNNPEPRVYGFFETDNLTENTTFNITCDNNNPPVVNTVNYSCQGTVVGSMDYVDGQLVAPGPYEGESCSQFATRDECLFHWYSHSCLWQAN